MRGTVRPAATGVNHVSVSQRANAHTE